MINSIVGSIPDKVFYEFLPPEITKTGGIVSHFFNDPNLKNESLQPTVVNQLNKKFNLNIIEKTNEPIKNIRIISLDYSLGNRRYKCSIDGMVVPIPEEAMIEAIFATGINKDGYLPGEYVWSIIRGIMKLVRVDSLTYNGIIEYQRRLKLKPISKKELEIGGIYATRSNCKAIYLGKVSSLECSKPRNGKSFAFTTYKTDNNLLFYNLYKEHELPSNLNDYGRSYLAKSHSFVSKLGQVDVKESVVDEVRIHFINKIKDILISVSNGTAPSYFGSYYSYRPGDLKDRIEREYIYMFKMLHLFPNKVDNIKEFDLKKYLNFL